MKTAEVPRVGDRNNDPNLVTLAGEMLIAAPCGSDDLPVGSPLRDAYDKLSGPQRDRVAYFFRGAAAQRKVREAEFARIRTQSTASIKVAIDAAEKAAAAERSFRRREAKIVAAFGLALLVACGVGAAVSYFLTIVFVVGGA